MAASRSGRNWTASVASSPGRRSWRARPLCSRIALPGSEAAGSEDPFVVVAPAGRDADVLCNLLRSAGLGHVADNDGETLLRALVDGGAAGAIVTDEAIARIDKERLKEAIERQPP